MRWLIEQTLTTLHAINKQTIIHYPKPIKRKNYKIFPKTHIRISINVSDRKIDPFQTLGIPDELIISLYRNIGMV